MIAPCLPNGPFLLQKLLSICSRNWQQSLTAKYILEKEAGYAVRSAGTEPGARTKLTPDLPGCTDVVFVMECNHRDRIWQRYRQLVGESPIVTPRIADEYTYMDEELIELLTDRVDAYLAGQ